MPEGKRKLLKLLLFAFHLVINTIYQMMYEVQQKAFYFKVLKQQI